MLAVRHCPVAARAVPRRAPRMVQRTVGKRSFATDKPGAKPAGKPGAAPASAPAGPPVDPDMDFPPPPGPEPKRPMAPHDPKNPLHSQFPGWPTTPPGEVPSHVKNIAEAIGRLNMVEAMQLNLILQSQLGITEENVKSWFGSMSGVVYAAPPGGAPPAGGAAGAAAAPKEEKKEKTTWNLKLVKVEEASKIKILKEIRLLRPGINLQETKALTEKLPSVLKEGVTKEEGESWVKKLKDVGGTVELE